MNISKHKHNQEIAQKLIQSVNNRLPKFIEIAKTKNGVKITPAKSEN